ncbi:MAG: hypothetical protein LBI54_10830 [Lachnospiraceae bacterium]|nr:hypothetical protein [Lachnospiraceae bacterium]
MFIVFLLSASNYIIGVIPVNQTSPHEGFMSTWVYVFVTLIVPLLTWLINPKDLNQRIKSYFSRKKINVSELELSIRQLKLGMCNERQLSVDEFVQSYKYVFFPVVPNTSPNIIHITFINAIKGLEKLGLYVIVFIYDDYFNRVRGYNQKERKAYIANFTKRLQDMGIRKGQIVYESRIINNRTKSHKMLMTFLDVASKLTVNEIDALAIVNKHYVSADTKYIRKFKSLLNIIYPMCISSKIGFVLSGEDEKKLWETYAQNFDNGIMHLYISSLYASSGVLGNILDEENLSYADSIDVLREKISKALTNQQLHTNNVGIFYLVNYNHFILGKHIEFGNADGTTLKISSVDALVEFCKAQFDNGGIKRETLDILSGVAYNIFHFKKGERT